MRHRCAVLTRRGPPYPRFASADGWDGLGYKQSLTAGESAECRGGQGVVRIMALVWRHVCWGVTLGLLRNSVDGGMSIGIDVSR